MLRWVSPEAVDWASGRWSGPSLAMLGDPGAGVPPRILRSTIGEPTEPSPPWTSTRARARPNASVAISDPETDRAGF